MKWHESGQTPWPGHGRRSGGLHDRYMHLVHDGGTAAPEALVAVTCELAGFIWADMTA